MLCSLHNYFCIGSNEGRERQQKSLLATLYSLQKATFNIFWATFEQRFEKLRETFWEISCRAICEKPYLTSPIFFKPPNTLTHTKFQHPPPPPSTPTSSYPFLYFKWTFPYPRSLHTNIINHYQWEINNRKTILDRKPNNIWNVQVCFRLLIFFTTTTSFQAIVTTLSLHNKLALPQLPSKKKHFLLPHIEFYEKPVWLINKLQPVSYQSMSNITPPLPLHLSQPVAASPPRPAR